MPEGVKIIAKNKKAWHDYFIDETFEAGISLAGTEVKSIRAGKISLKESFAMIKEGEIFLVGAHISPYEHGNIFNKDPLRTRKLLLHKREIAKLAGNVTQKGCALVPLSVYLSKGRVKVEIGLARGKKMFDKRQDQKDKDAKRQIDQHLKSNRHAE